MTQVTGSWSGTGSPGPNPRPPAARDTPPPPAGAEPSPPPRVVDLDRHRTHAEQVAGLERPGKLFQRRTVEATQEDLGERLALALIGSVVEVEVEARGRARLVVVVADGHRHAKTRDVHVSGLSLVDR